MKKITLAIILFLALASPAAAQEPTPTPNFDMPYEFEKFDYDTSVEIPSIDIFSMVSAPEFINTIGSAVLTSWDMLITDYSGGASLVSILVVIIMGVWLIKWMARYVFNRRDAGNTTEIDAAEFDADSEGDAPEWTPSNWSKFGRVLADRKKARF